MNPRLKEFLFSLLPLVATTVVILKQFVDFKDKYFTGQKIPFGFISLLQFLASLNLFEKFIWSGVFICYIFLLIISIQRILDDRNKFKNSEKEKKDRLRSEPVGFFYSRIDPVIRQQQQDESNSEFSLVEIYRNGSGKLCYRGINKKRSSDGIDFWWNCIDTWVQLISKEDEKYRFVFHTNNQDIHSVSGSKLPDITNLGFANYNLNGENMVSHASGTFFDYCLSDTYLQRKDLDLYEASKVLSDEDKNIFYNYFNNPAMNENRENAINILKKIESYYDSSPRER